MIKSGIYALISPSGKAYIGSSRNLTQRRYAHLSALKRNVHHCIYLQRAWNKYNGQFRYEIIEYCDVDLLIKREQYWIDNHLSRFVGMYNNGLIAGRVDHTPDVRAKMSASHKGKKLTIEQRQRMSLSRMGHKDSVETVNKRAASNRGKKRSLETRLKISIARKRGYALRKGIIDEI